MRMHLFPKPKWSLVPPPWLELTTSEPSFKATRVKPPGTTRTPSAPERTKGRRSTWRGATPPGEGGRQVESDRVGWAMKLSGLAKSFCRKVSISFPLACGPTSMP